MSSLITLDGDNTVQLNFHAGQAKAWLSTSRFVFIISGTQGGKTSFGVWWLYREIQEKGGGDYLAVSPTYDLFQLKMLPELQSVFVRLLKIGKYWPSARVIEIAEPSTGKFLSDDGQGEMYARIILRSATAEGGLESATAKAAWLDEVGQDDFKLEAWEAVLRRVSLAQGRILATTTPYNLGWLKLAVYDKWVTGDKNFDVINFPSIANPNFDQKEFERAKASLPPHKFKMFYLGQFARPVGLIFSDFIDQLAPDGHLYTPFPLPKTYHHYVGIDPGAVNTAKIWVAIDKVTRNVFVYRESMSGGKSIKQHANDILDLARTYDEKIIRYYVGTKSESQIRMDYEQAGVKPCLPPPIPDVEIGIDRIVELFRINRLFISTECVGLIDQLLNYSRVVDNNGQTLDTIQDKSKYHLIDALRYACASVDSPRGVLLI